jgi:hypothetical protein
MKWNNIKININQRGEKMNKNRSLFYMSTIIYMTSTLLYADEYILDNNVAELTGNWSLSTWESNFHDTDYVFINTGTGSNKMIWRPNITTAGDYEIFVKLPNGNATRANNAPFTVYYDGGNQTYLVDEQITPGGTWETLGTHTFLAGTTGYVELTDNGSNTYIIGDAIKLVSVSAPTEPNVALNKPVSADSTYSTYVAKNAVDGVVSDSSRWLSANTAGPHWLEIDLLSSLELQCAILDSGWGVQDAISNFEIQSWGSNQWNTIAGTSVTNNSKNTLALNFLAPVTTDKIRFYTDSAGYVRLKELAIYQNLSECSSAPVPVGDIPTIYLNQSGFNLNESKKFTVPLLADNTPFTVQKVGEATALFNGIIQGNVGDFSAFNPSDTGNYIIVADGSTSVPFGIGPYWNERISTQLSLDFMIDTRCYVGTHNSCINAVAWRDTHQFGFEIPTLVAQYLANPSAYDRMPSTVSYVSGYGDLDAPSVNAPDIIKLIHWAIDRYHGQSINHTLFKEQLAYFLYAYPSISEHISQSDYNTIRDFLFNSWGNVAKERFNWYDITHTADLFQTYTVMGTGKGQLPPGHSIMPNLLMHQVALREGRTDAQNYFDAAYNQAQWIVNNIDWNSPEATKGQRMSEHVTMEGLAYFMKIYPTQAPAGLLASINSWTDVVISRSDNMWGFRKYDSNNGWVIPGFNEVGNVPGLVASIYAAIDVISDQSKIDELKHIATAQLDNMFGRNPTGRHFAFDAADWEGVEFGWYNEYINGAGRLNDARGVLDGSPKPEHYPYYPDAGNPGWTEGWVNHNTSWNSALAYSSHYKTDVKIWNSTFTSEASNIQQGSTFGIQLIAPLNFDYGTVETGYVLVTSSSGDSEKVLVTEPNISSLDFRAIVQLNNSTPVVGDGTLQVGLSDTFEVSYGLGYFKKSLKFIGNGAGVFNIE